tara:strand:+ start:660 stop:986 length:327 start_codon:yes stop_codon:yes gene_type:complete
MRKKVKGPFKMKKFSGFGEGTGKKSSPAKLGFIPFTQGYNFMGAMGGSGGSALDQLGSLPTPMQGVVGFPGIGSGGGNVPTPTPTQGGGTTQRRPVRTRPRKGTRRLR